MLSFRFLAALGAAAWLLPAVAAAQASRSEARFAAEALSSPRYGAMLEEPSAEDLLRDHAHAVAALIRGRLSRGESLTPELLSEAKHLQR
ncbi:MAG: hypothetical protein PHU21_09365, partial [Elusimicrobia bacterium]|nr:hypothetical protein [Elusimicrobiota bacterium]